MNAILNTTTDSTLTVSLIGQNFTTGRSYVGQSIPLDFFAKASEMQHEIDVHNIKINGYVFSGDAMSGYDSLNTFINTLASEDNETDIGVIHALLSETGLVTLDEVFTFAESKVLAHTLNSDELGLTDLSEIYGQERSDAKIEEITQNMPKHLEQDLNIYWNHAQFIEDLFINECKLIKKGKVQVVVSNH